MEGMTFKKGAAQQLIQRRELGQELAWDGLLLRHLYRCYMIRRVASIHFLKTCLGLEQLSECAASIGMATTCDVAYGNSSRIRIRTL